MGITNINLFFSGWWTLFIIIPCFIGLFKEEEKTGNIIGLFIGVVLLLCCQDLIDFDMIWKLFIPAILVAIGVSFIFKDTISGKVNKEIKNLNKTRKDEKGENEFCATFAGQNINFDNQEFNGADLTAVFGGVKCDLRKSVINKDVVINCSAIFGGIDIYVPQDIKIKIKSVPIFGGVSNKTAQVNKEDAHTIYINAQSVFGGIEIK